MEINCTILMRRSMVTRMTVYPWEQSSSTMKFKDAKDQDQGRIGKGWRRQSSLAHRHLLWQHRSHELMYSQ